MFIIGERINPAGKPALAFAIREGKTVLIQQEALEQERAGVDALDIQASLRDVDSAQVMQKVVETIRFISKIPLVIDDRNPEIIEVGLRTAGGSTFINSPMDQDSTDTRIFSLAKEFKAEVLFLPLKRNRIPANIEEHLQTSSLILKRFEENGISRTRVVVDAMLLAFKQAKEKVIDTLERIKRLKAELGVRTVIGLSNISYGFKNRDRLNARFLKLAKGCGLDFVICDPLQKEIMKVAKEEAGVLTQLDAKKFLEFAETCGS
ncbi:MAG: dihydropteroate synthase [Candidatus Omnitrophica bacterium]|nr:dihydropteroate synthase [Candidatus Omnitrophota bacterium]